VPPPDAAAEIERTGPPEEIRAVPVRHWGRWIAAVVVALLVAALIKSVVTNPRFEWDVVGGYLFDSTIFDGIKVTLELTVPG
jgi:polar amino acid transport system permease protein